MLAHVNCLLSLFLLRIKYVIQLIKAIKGKLKKENLFNLNPLINKCNGKIYYKRDKVHMFAYNKKIGNSNKCRYF